MKKITRDDGSEAFVPGGDATEVRHPFDRQSLLNFASATVTDAIMLADKKNQDYAGDDDPFRNLRRGGAFGIAVRMDDKVSRLLTLSNPMAQPLPAVDESIEDTCKDLINYAWLLLALREDHKRREG